MTIQPSKDNSTSKVRRGAYDTASTSTVCECMCKDHSGCVSALFIAVIGGSLSTSGRTQIEAGSTTVLGVGPAPVDLVNVVTSEQKLL